MIDLFTDRFRQVFSDVQLQYPWEVTEQLEQILMLLMGKLGPDYNVNDGIAVHRSAVIEQNVILKPPVIVSPNAFIAANAYIRGPVFLDKDVKVGAGCEIKQSILLAGTATAHFNYIGNSVVGSRVNFEAGSIAANHFNERADKRISVRHNGALISTGVTKFGSLVGDDSKIGANAVLSPGSLLPKETVVGRLALHLQS